MSLPGVTSNIKDAFYRLSRTNIPVGPKVVVLGRRLTDNGTVANGFPVQDLDPYNLADEQSVIKAFGRGSDIHRAYIELVSGGAPAVTAVALPSDTIFDHVSGTIQSASFDSGDPSGDLFDVAFDAVEAAQPDLVIPYGRGTLPWEWYQNATPTDDIEVGFHADNSTEPEFSWVTKIADKVSQINANTSPCLAILGVKPFDPSGISTESMTPSQIRTHLTLPNLVNREEATLTTGIYACVVATELKPVRYPTDFGYANGAATFAGALTQLNSWSSPTAKSISNISTLRYRPSNSTKISLVNKAAIPVDTNYSRYPVWVDAMTFAREGSDYSRLTTIRIVFDSIQLIRQVAQGYVGEAATLQNRNALETSISSGLRGMQQQGALYASDYIMNYDPINNAAIIDLVLSPAYELRTIEIRVSVQL